MKQKNRYVFVSIIAGLLFWALTGVMPLSAAEQNPCTEDIAKFCKEVQSDRAAIMACLEAHESELSDSCKHHEAMMEGRKGEARESARVKMRFLQSCRADIIRFCKDVDTKEGGYVNCINEHQKELSASCADWIKEDREEQTKAK